MTRHTMGFTLVELLVGMLITSIVLSAVATFAFALSVATNGGDDKAVKQVQLRQTTLRIRDLVATCQLLCAAPGNDLVVWKADDNRDNLINVNEIAYLEYDDPNDSLKVREFHVASNPTVLAALGLAPTDPVLTTLAQAGTKAALVQKYASGNQVRRLTLLQECRHLEFTADQNPPYSRRLIISFDVSESGAVHRYEIVAALQSRAGHLLNSAGTALVVSDDD